MSFTKNKTINMLQQGDKCHMQPHSSKMCVEIVIVYGGNKGGNVGCVSLQWKNEWMKNI